MGDNIFYDLLGYFQIAQVAGFFDFHDEGVAMGQRRIQLEKLIKEFPDDPEVLYGLAMDSLSDGLWDQGIQEFKQIVLNCPSFIPAYLQLGQVYVRLGQEYEALEIYRQGIKIASRLGDEKSADEMRRFSDQLI